MGRDAQATGHVEGRVGSHFENEAGIDRVDRVHRRLHQVHGAAAFVLEVLHVPDAAAGERQVEPGGRRVELVQRHPLLDGGGEHEGLERRPGRAFALGRQVELGLAPAAEEVAPANQGPDVPGRGLEGHDRGRGIAARLGEHLGNGLLGLRLLGQVDSGVDAQATVEEVLLALGR